jgi:hypothetical protein
MGAPSIATTDAMPEVRNLAAELSVLMSRSRTGVPAGTARRQTPSCVPIAVWPENVCTGRARSRPRGFFSGSTMSAP